MPILNDGYNCRFKDGGGDYKFVFIGQIDDCKWVFIGQNDGLRRLGVGAQSGGQG